MLKMRCQDNYDIRETLNDVIEELKQRLTIATDLGNTRREIDFCKIECFKIFKHNFVKN